jgi:rod shape-determining protein MreC
MDVLTVRKNNAVDSYIHNTISIIDIYDSIYIQKYQFIQGRVINNSTNKQNNYLTLNIGKRSGVHKEMAVISPVGVVGVVKDVSDNFSSVISLLNRNLRISAMIKRSGYFGSLYWDGKNYHYAKLTDLPNHIVVNKGDTVITSGYSAMFPKGEIIGIVDKVENQKGSDFMTVTVRLSVDFKKLDYVMVVKNLLREEQLQLEHNIDYD